ncbi:hypothetical protein QQP08_009901 [Theobroma cacao]|nr:hypothetical protein QQP08_009901 [Theobroma cacao]
MGLSLEPAAMAADMETKKHELRVANQLKAPSRWSPCTFTLLALAAQRINVSVNMIFTVAVSQVFNALPFEFQLLMFG